MTKSKKKTYEVWGIFRGHIECLCDGMLIEAYSPAQAQTFLTLEISKMKFYAQYPKEKIYQIIKDSKIKFIERQSAEELVEEVKGGK